MGERIDKIGDIKDKLQKESVQINNKDTQKDLASLEIFDPKKRAEIANRISKFIEQEGLGMFEAVLGFTDLFSAVFIEMLARHHVTEENIAKSEERISKIMKDMSASLNNYGETNFIENLTVFAYLMAETVAIIKEIDMKDESAE